MHRALDAVDRSGSADDDGGERQPRDDVPGRADETQRDGTERSGAVGDGLEDQPDGDVDRGPAEDGPEVGVGLGHGPPDGGATPFEAFVGARDQHGDGVLRHEAEHEEADDSHAVGQRGGSACVLAGLRVGDGVERQEDGPAEDQRHDGRHDRGDDRDGGQLLVGA